MNRGTWDGKTDQSNPLLSLPYFKFFMYMGWVSSQFKVTVVLVVISALCLSFLQHKMMTGSNNL